MRRHPSQVCGKPASRWRFKVAPLFKPIRRNLFSAGVDFKCFVVTVLYSRQGNRRFFLNLSRHHRQLPKVLTTTLNTLRWKNWHTFFMLTPAREFLYWRLRYPMNPINALDREATSSLELCRKKLKVICKPKRWEGHGRKHRNAHNSIL
ncbi:uncharacterized protein LOC116655924 [Drosophila ananassae]|uniref:uncharacterized protein LOC116655924 n=1 Tax=Drosophila ananassae TaxID=7217 RepID=UPI000177C858|nr:uncharacterized protein LOC116655924 [Drosophila ananassae]